MRMHNEAADRVPGRIDFCEALGAEPDGERVRQARVSRGTLCIVRGWIVGADTARRVEVVADGATIALAETGSSREDVARALQRPEIERCGIAAVFSTAELAVGERRLTIEVTDRSGTKRRSDGDAFVLTIDERARVGSEAIGNIDEVRINDVAVTNEERSFDVVPDDVIVIRGWILDARSHRPGSVAALVVEGVGFAALYGMRRDDIAAIYGDDALACGFVGSFEVSSLPTHESSVSIGLLVGNATTLAQSNSVSIRLRQPNFSSKESE